MRHQNNEQRIFGQDIAGFIKSLRNRSFGQGLPGIIFSQLQLFNQRLCKLQKFFSRTHIPGKHRVSFYPRQLGSSAVKQMEFLGYLARRLMKRLHYRIECEIHLLLARIGHNKFANLLHIDSGRQCSIPIQPYWHKIIVPLRVLLAAALQKF
ncbi:hypothetical protein D3C75_1008320 [compost metagenome]